MLLHLYALINKNHALVIKEISLMASLKKIHFNPNPWFPLSLTVFLPLYPQIIQDLIKISKEINAYLCSTFYVIYFQINKSLFFTQFSKWMDVFLKQLTGSTGIFPPPTFTVKLANMLSNSMTFVHTLVYKNVAWYLQIRKEGCGNETSFVINK